MDINSINGKSGRSMFLRNVLVNRTRCQNPEVHHLYNTTLEAIKLTHDDCFANDTIQTLVTLDITAGHDSKPPEHGHDLHQQEVGRNEARAVTCQCTQLPLPNSFTPLHTARWHTPTTSHKPRSAIEQIKRH